MIHRNFGQWVEHLRNIAEEYDIAQFLQADVVTKYLEDVKAKDNQKRAQRKAGEKK